MNSFCQGSWGHSSWHYQAAIKPLRHALQLYVLSDSWLQWYFVGQVGCKLHHLK